MKQIKIEEFHRGDLPSGDAIGAYRSGAYAAFKQRMNPLAGGDVDLILTGAFSNSFFVKSKGDSKFTFDATDSKKGELTAKYGEEIMGVSQERFEQLQKNIFARQLRRKIVKEFNV